MRRLLAGLALLASIIGAQAQDIGFSPPIQAPPPIGFNNFTGSNLALMQAGLAAQAAGTRNTRWMAFGDSTDTGAGAGTSGSSFLIGARARCWENQLATLTVNSGVQNQYADGGVLSTGVSLNAYNPAIVLGSGWSLGGSTTLGGNFWITSTDMATASFTPTISVDTFIIEWIPEGGTVNVNLDGGSTLATLTGAGGAVTFTTVTATLGIHTLNLVQSGATQSFIASVYAYNSAVKEISILNGGYYAQTSTSLSSTVAVWSPLSVLANAGLNIDLALIEGGVINDWQGAPNVTLAQSLINFQKMITQTKPRASVILMSGAPTNPATVPYATQQAYVDQMKALAYSNNVPFIDIWRLIIAQGGWSASRYIDNIHPNFTEYGLIAGWVNQGLQTGFTAP